MTDLTAEYQKLVEKYEFTDTIDAPKMLSIIRQAIVDFMSAHSNVALYCNGYHTKMLMADFIYELKNVKIIVDNYADKDKSEGFIMIRDDEMREYHVNGVIISSFDYMDSIARDMAEKTPEIPYLNIYKVIRESGIDIQNAYYENAHPYQYYKTINALQRRIAKEPENRDELYHRLIGEYIRIKDFRTAIEKAKEWGKRSDLLADLRKIYQMELDVAKNLSDEHVLMLCIDGTRRDSVSEDKMPKMCEYIKRAGKLFSNAYSYSTSTYESLIPVYSENSDMETKYFDNNFIREDGCRFVQVAKKQGRNLFFYTDMTEYVEDSDIRRSDSFQTATEKIWNFLVDAKECKYGLFYVHILYESHYSFVNPYTEAEILAEGTAMLFDYLDTKGGNLRADYVQQHRDAMRYLDDVVTPFLEVLPCKVVLYADHGNTMLEKGTKLEEVSPQLLTCHEDLIEVPLAVIDRNGAAGEDSDLISLMELNNIIISLMEKTEYVNPKKEWAKIGRSTIYNLDFHFLYSKMNAEKRLQAFEGFVFRSGEKLVVYADGEKELYSSKDDSVIDDAARKDELFAKVASEVTVC